jgi:hypothetical protein
MKIWIKRIFDNKAYFLFLIGYMLIQLSTLIFHSFLLFILYETFFIVAMILAIHWIYNTYKTERIWTPIGLSIFLNFLSNLILTIIYIPTLYLNPKINWKLENGGGESDPMILLTFYPTAHFIIASLIISISGLIICKLYNSK